MHPLAPLPLPPHLLYTTGPLMQYWIIVYWPICLLVTCLATVPARVGVSRELNPGKRSHGFLCNTFPPFIYLSLSFSLSLSLSRFSVGLLMWYISPDKPYRFVHYYNFTVFICNSLPFFITLSFINIKDIHQKKICFVNIYLKFLKHKAHVFNCKKEHLSSSYLSLSIFQWLFFRTEVAL